MAYMIALGTLGGLTLAAGRAWWPIAVVVALAAGTLLPPVAPAFRAALPRLTKNTSEATRVLTWEATLQELIFILGPPAIVAVAAIAGGSSALLVVAVVAGVGSLAFGYALHRTRSWSAGDEGDPTTDTGRAHGRTSTSPGIDSRARRTLIRLSVAYGHLLAALTALTLVAVDVAVRRGHPGAAAWLEASIAAGSMLGGGLASRGLLECWRLSARLAGMAVALVGLVAVTATSASLLVTALSLASAGLWIAPSLALHGAAVLAAAPEGRRAEAFGWVNAAGMGINAAVTPVAGLVLESAGARGGAAVAAVAALIAGFAVAGIVERTP
jgi:hypothetical protein